MKKEIHPENYRLVVFQDVSCDYSFLTHSTVKTTETIKWDDGNEYPLYKLEISNKSHPYFTGQQNLIDTAGRIEKFNQKYNLKEPVSQNSSSNNTVSEEVDSPEEAPSNDAISEAASQEDKNAQDS